MASSVPSLVSASFSSPAGQSPWSALLADGVRRLVSKAGLLLRPDRQECEVARFIDRNGGRLTDSLEREIGRRFGSPVL
jgi:hypothetical protein